MRHGYLVAAGVWVAAILVGAVVPGIDAAQFYEHRFPEPYSQTDYSSGSGFYYSPPVALLFAPLTAFGLAPFAALLSGAGLLSLYYLLGRWAFLGLFFPPVWWDIMGGNIGTLMGAAIVIGLRHPAAFAVPLLTKVTPGISVLWFAFTRQWRQLAIAVGVTGALCVASFVVAPYLWFQWVASVSGNVGYMGPGFFTIDVPLLPRLVLAVALLATRKPWAVPIAATVAIPVLWYTTLATLVAVVPLWSREQVIRAVADPVHGPAGALPVDGGSTFVG